MKLGPVHRALFKGHQDDLSYPIPKMSCEILSSYITKILLQLGGVSVSFLV